MLTVSNGTLTLSGTNSYGGGTMLTGGVLSIAADADLGPTTGAVTLNGGELQVNTAGGAVAIAAARPITLGANGGTINVPSTANLASYGGAMTGGAAPAIRV